MSTLDPNSEIEGPDYWFRSLWRAWRDPDTGVIKTEELWNPYYRVQDEEGQWIAPEQPY